MTPLLWLAMPVLVTIVATAWAAWLARDRPPAEPYETVQVHRRFVDALSQNVRIVTTEPASEPEPGSTPLRPDSS